MRKYQLLSDHFAASPGDEWRASFGELEAVMGFPLPKGARSGRAWWTNDLNKSHSRAWAAHGWEVGDVDHAAERVVFRRGLASEVALAPAAELKPLGATGVESRPAPVKPIPRLGGAVALAGLAVVAGLGTMLVRGVMRRR